MSSDISSCKALSTCLYRGKPPQAGKHWSAEPPFGFGQRARFRVPAAESFTALVIKVVTLLDEGVYRCRVDYRNSPTRNMKLNLTVVGKRVGQLDFPIFKPK